MDDTSKTHELVKNAYGEVARKQGSCCGPAAAKTAEKAEKSISCCGKSGEYVVPDHPVPESELGLSCGNPLAFGQIRKGDVVLDLGSGAGKDVFLAAQKVGEAGRAIGVDMTPDMLALARKNAVKFFQTTGLTNVEFRQGQIEKLPVEDGTVDAAISNCVINLSPDKARVFREVFRVLKCGGRMIVSDIVLNQPLPRELRDDENLFAHCIAGALMREDYLAAIRGAGFGKIEILADRTYKPSGLGVNMLGHDIADMLAGVAASITVLAVK